MSESQANKLAEFLELKTAKEDVVQDVWSDSDDTDTGSGEMEVDKQGVSNSCLGFELGGVCPCYFGMR